MQPFLADVPNDFLDDLRARLTRTRWPARFQSNAWQQGTDQGFLKRLCTYWAEDFDWRQAEQRLNKLPQFITSVDGMKVHFVLAKSERPNAVPLLLVNGWPSSIFEYIKVIPLLTASGFDVVAPTLPGYGFSGPLDSDGINGSRIATAFASLMAELGYEQFIAHGSDWGSLVVDRLQRHHADRLIGAHLSNVHPNYPRPENLTPQEEVFLGKAQGWQFLQGAYAMIQGTKPRSLGFGLNDSPAGLAAWVLEKFQCWTDGDLESVYGLDELCANLTLYWATETIDSSIQMYAEAFADPEMRAAPVKSAVPVGVVVFPADINPAPRCWGERWFNIVHWSEAPCGGHFGAWEEPDFFAKELRAFADKVLPR